MINRMRDHSALIAAFLAILNPVSTWADESKQFRKRLSSGDPVRIVCFGDSVTGLYYHTGRRRTYTDMLGIALRKAVPNAKVSMINAGISGNTAVAGLKRLERDVLSKKPDLVTVMFGLNDMVRRSLGQYRKNLEEIVTRCRAANVQVILCTPNAVTDTSSRPTSKLIQFCRFMREVAKQHRVPLCDTYAAFDRLRTTDRPRWRLTMSDAIHPNMGGHQFIAEQIAKTMTGQAVSMEGTPPPSDPLRHTKKLIAATKPIHVFAMSPADELIASILQQTGTSTTVKATPWVTANKSLAQFESQARATVRKMKPDLVIVAVPGDAACKSEEEFIKAQTWIHNWSQSFGRQEWDCVVIHPAVFRPVVPATKRDELLRRLVRAQDLHLIDRTQGDERSAKEIVRAWFQRELKD